MSHEDANLNRHQRPHDPILLGQFLLEQTARALEENPEAFRLALDQAGGAYWDPDEFLSMYLAREKKPALFWEKVQQANPDLQPSQVFRLSPMEAATRVLRVYPDLDGTPL